MSLLNYGKNLVAIFSIVFTSHAVFQYLTKKKKSEPEDIIEVFMFSETSEVVKNKVPRANVPFSMSRVLSYINKSRYTLDICMYVLTNAEVADVIKKLNYKGVKVRLIIDADMAFCTGSAVKSLEKRGVAVRWRKSTSYMHHKFCLLDASTDNQDVTPVVMTGSLNWTNQAFYRNWENFMVLSHPKAVQAFKEEFERLWDQFKPIV